MTTSGAHQRICAVFTPMVVCASDAYRNDTGNLTFEELSRLALSLAQKLAERQPDNRSPVLVVGHKDRRFIIAYWACLLSGRPVVPVEADLPWQRVEAVAALTGATLLLDAEPSGRPRAMIANVLSLDVELTVGDRVDHHEPLRPAPADVADDDTAYILFSTGTTGTPKGIRISYANLADFVDWMRQMSADIGEVGCLTGNVRYCFDVSLFEMWLSWLNRTPISAVDHGDIWNVGKYIEQFRRDGLSVWVSTPTLAAHYLRSKAFSRETLPELRVMIFCGEVLPKSLVRGLMDRFDGIRIFNTYGPTECTVAVTAVEIDRAHIEAEAPLPIGRSRHGTWLSFAECDGALGEIVINGASVGNGYFGASPEQAARFVTPSSYLTGDWGWVDDEGYWYFHGRRDREIKLDGHRIDLNAVEAAIRDCAGVGDVIVAPPEQAARTSGLRAFILGVASAEEVAAIASETAARLAPHMVPRFWYGQENRAFNTSAKLDRKQVQAEMLAMGSRYIHAPVRAVTAVEPEVVT